MAKTEDVKVEKTLEIETKLKKPESIKASPVDDIMTEETVE
jgi:hypothetical protein